MRLIFTVLLSFIVSTANAVNVQEITSPKLGIKAYLVQSNSLPMVNVQVAFRSGNAFESTDKLGLSYLTASLLDEGAAEKDSKAFLEAIDDIGALMSIAPDLLTTKISLRSLSEYKSEAFKLLSDALTKPRFDKDAFDRMKDAVFSQLKQIEENPGSLASQLLKENLYKGHPYGQYARGTNETVNALTVNDIKNFYRQNYTRRNMTVSVVGDISKEELMTALDEIFKDLPEGTVRNEIVKSPIPITPSIIRKSMPVPQSSIHLAHLGINRQDPDYYAAYAMNYILGGGGFNSRLMEEIREKRGLAYGVYSYFEMLPHKGAFVAGVNTKNKDADNVIKLIKKEMSRIKTDGITDKEYEGAMSYLKGSFPLKLDSSSKIINYLTVMQMENLGIDYLSKWTTRIGSVTKIDMERAAKRLLNENEMVIIIVGGEK